MQLNSNNILRIFVGSGHLGIDLAGPLGLTTIVTISIYAPTNGRMYYLK